MSETKKTWKCNVCGYLYNGDTAPESCPVCGAGKEQFEEYEQEQKKKQKK